MGSLGETAVGTRTAQAEGPPTVPSTVAFLASAAAWTSTAWWLIDLRRVADWAAPGHPHRRSSWWALAAWVVPVVNLWFPYQLVADCSRALRSRVTGFWPWWIVRSATRAAADAVSEVRVPS